MADASSGAKGRSAGRSACTVLLVQVGGRAGKPKIGAQASSHPNIVLVTADDQGWGETSYRGHPRPGGDLACA